MDVKTCYSTKCVNATLETVLVGESGLNGPTVQSLVGTEELTEAATVSTLLIQLLVLSSRLLEQSKRRNALGDPVRSGLNGKNGIRAQLRAEAARDDDHVVACTAQAVQVVK